MTGQQLQLFTPMSPDAFAPLDGAPGCLALARDDEFRLIWCNKAYAAENESDPDSMVGTTLFTTLPKRLAEERAALMRPALHEGRMVAYHQVWKGVRWLTRVWPLDPDAFGHPGYFVVLTRLHDEEDLTQTDTFSIQFVRSADLGDLDILSPRELEVYYYLAAGMTVTEIAHTLFRSQKTIGRHVENIHRKMGYTSRAELVRDAVSRGVVAYSGQEWLEIVDPRNA